MQDNPLREYESHKPYLVQVQEEAHRIEDGVCDHGGNEAAAHFPEQAKEHAAEDNERISHDAIWMNKAKYHARYQCGNAKGSQRHVW